MAIPTFGTKLPRRTYQTRPGAYAVIQNDNGKIAVVKTHGSKYLFLSGGGIDAGESPEETVVREVGEECELGIDLLYEIGRADHYVYSDTKELGLHKQATFFAARLNNKKVPKIELDHELVWHPFSYLYFTISSLI